MTTTRQQKGFRHFFFLIFYILFLFLFFCFNFYILLFFIFYTLLFFFTFYILFFIFFIYIYIFLEERKKNCRSREIIDRERMIIECIQNTKHIHTHSRRIHYTFLINHSDAFLTWNVTRHLRTKKHHLFRLKKFSIYRDKLPTERGGKKY